MERRRIGRMFRVKARIKYSVWRWNN